jgi:hypothetical protein
MPKGRQTKAPVIRGEPKSRLQMEGKSTCLNTSRLLKNPAEQAAEKCPDARHPKFPGMKRTWKYAAMTGNEGNAAGGRFSAAC